MFNSHCHLDDIAFDADREEVISRFLQAGGTLLLNPASDLASSQRALALAHKYPFIYAAVGVHPHEARDMTEDTLSQIKASLSDDKCVALGEIGLDYYYDLSDRETQRYWFFKQLELAAELDVPVIIHDRDAHAECVEAVREFGVKGVFHCYSGSAETAKELMKLGFYISFTGAVTFKNARRAVEAAAIIDTDKLMIETDCPYLTPEPLRGRRNEPANVLLVAQKLAQIRNETPENIVEQTEKNGKRLFNIL